MRIWIVVLCIISLISLPIHADASEQTEPKAGIEKSRRILPLKITITKSRWATVKDVPGAGNYVGEKDIKKAATTDVTRVLQQVPGVNIQEEDGFGLRPNIGLRGGRVDRSADITLMEDGVLIAPAPYAAPEAYYFPRIERMTGIEVRKGSSTLKFGPRTTNGAVNLLTREVPYVTSGEVATSIGSHGGFRAGGHTGTAVSNEYGSFGVLAEFHHDNSDGFKSIDTVGGDSGFNLSDYMTKFRYSTPMDARYYQELELKLGYTDEDSNETYLGLTSSDFNANPYRRYAASQVDHMDAHHYQTQLTHYIEPVSDTSLATTVYRNDFNRNWYRLNSVRAGGINASLANALSDAAPFAGHLNIVRGADSVPDALTVRANIRDYYAQGIQMEGNHRLNLLGIHHDIEVGLRYHEDEQDRFQHDDRYQMIGGVLTRTSRGAPGSESNRISSADAWAGYLLNRMDFGALAVTPGLRYEYIDLETIDYGKSDPMRSGSGQSRFSSNVTAVIPGVGVEYDITQQVQLLGGVHKGFAPPAPPRNAADAENAREEESINYEAGVRYQDDVAFAEAIGFFTDYENLLGTDTFSAGGAGSGESFNGGEVEVRGVETSAGYDAAPALGLNSIWRVPAKISYTYTHAEFQNSFSSSFAEWGDVNAGDQLPYIAPHQVALSLAVENDIWQIALSAKYLDRMRTVAGSGALLDEFSTDGSFVMDAHAEYEVTDGVRPFVSVNNLLDEEYIAARRPAGVRPGAPRIVYAGVKVAF